MQIKAILLIAFFSWVGQAAGLQASSTAKVFKGKEGLKVTTAEVNASKQVLVKIENLSGAWNGATFLWELEDQGDTKNIFFNKKQGSKTKRFTAMSYREGFWTLYPEGTGKEHFLVYDEALSKTAKAEDLIKSYRPNN